MLSTVFALFATAAGFAAAAPQINTGPGPVVLTTFCDADACDSSPLQSGQCIELAGTEFDNNVRNFTVGPVFSTAPAITCTLFDFADCASAGPIYSFQNPGGDITDTALADTVSSYRCQ